MSCKPTSPYCNKSLFICFYHISDIKILSFSCFLLDKTKNLSTLTHCGFVPFFNHSLLFHLTEFRIIDYLFFQKIHLFYFVCVRITVCMCVHLAGVLWCPLRLKENVRSPRTGVTVCVLPWGYWELKPSPLQKHQVLLTSEPSSIPFVLAL